MITGQITIALPPNLRLDISDENIYGVRAVRSYNEDLQWEDTRNFLGVLANDSAEGPSLKEWEVEIILQEPAFQTLALIIDTWQHYQVTGVQHHILWVDGVSDIFPVDEERIGTQLSSSTHAGVEVEEKVTTYCVFPDLGGEWWERSGSTAPNANCDYAPDYFVTMRLVEMTSLRAFTAAVFGPNAIQTYSAQEILTYSGESIEVY